MTCWRQIWNLGAIYLDGTIHCLFTMELFTVCVQLWTNPASVLYKTDHFVMESNRPHSIRFRVSRCVCTVAIWASLLHVLRGSCTEHVPNQPFPPPCPAQVEHCSPPQGDHSPVSHVQYSAPIKAPVWRLAQLFRNRQTGDAVYQEEWSRAPRWSLHSRMKHDPGCSPQASSKGTSLWFTSCWVLSLSAEV